MPKRLIRNRQTGRFHFVNFKPLPQTEPAATRTFPHPPLTQNARAPHSYAFFADGWGPCTRTKYSYDAFGNLIAHAGATPNAYLYRGERYDSDLGLYYLRACWYNPVSGRFMTRDPYQGSIYDPASLHRYNYARASPVNFIDPSGRASALEYGAVVLDIVAEKIAVAAFGEEVNCAIFAVASGVELVGETVGQDVLNLWTNFKTCSAKLTVRQLLAGAAFGFALGAAGDAIRAVGAELFGAAEGAEPWLAAEGPSSWPAEAAPTFRADPDLLSQYGRNVPTESNSYFNVVTHADANLAYVIQGGNYVGLSSRSLGNYINSLPDYSGQPVCLVACSAGATTNGLAQNLANKLGVDVLASTEAVYVYQSGAFWTPGQWIVFSPGP